jgi:hypothetical protein
MQSVGEQERENGSPPSGERIHHQKQYRRTEKGTDAESLRSGNRAPVTEIRWINRRENSTPVPFGKPANCPNRLLKAGDGIRTHDNHVGNVMLYQLSYTRTGKRLTTRKLAAQREPIEGIIGVRCALARAIAKWLGLSGFRRATIRRRRSRGAANKWTYVYNIWLALSTAVCTTACQADASTVNGRFSFARASIGFARRFAGLCVSPWRLLARCRRPILTVCRALRSS